MKQLSMFWKICFFCILAAFMIVPCAAEEEAREITSIDLVAPGSMLSRPLDLFDGDFVHSVAYSKGCCLTLTHEEGIGSLYFTFKQEYESMTLTNDDTGETFELAVNGMLHKFADLSECFEAIPNRVTICFSSGNVQLNEVQVFTPGKVPGWVQKWEEPLEGKADLLLLSAHGDDEQLFFAGILPYYAGELGYNVQVVYFTDHRNFTVRRMHEMLDGLWAVGVRAYPVFGAFPDKRIDSLEETIEYYKGFRYSRETMEGFVVEQLRRFQPLVAVTHDPEGEYGHGMHMLCSSLMQSAAVAAGEEWKYTESIPAYGVWDVPKVYLHLYPENPIVMNWDTPLEHFDGMTAYEVTKDLGFPCHVSQYEDFLWFYEGAQTAAQVKAYSPCQYGLFRSTVGEDVNKNDFFENLTPRGVTETMVVPEETQVPEQTQPETIPQAEEIQPPQPDAEPENVQQIPRNTQGGWLLIPAVGAVILACAAAVLNRKQKN